jgi:hypothetical protein
LSNVPYLRESRWGWSKYEMRMENDRVMSSLIMSLNASRRFFLAFIILFTWRNLFNVEMSCSRSSPTFRFKTLDFYVQMERLLIRKRRFARTGETLIAKRRHCIMAATTLTFIELDQTLRARSRAMRKTTMFSTCREPKQVCINFRSD